MPSAVNPPGRRRHAMVWQAPPPAARTISALLTLRDHVIARSWPESAAPGWGADAESGPLPTATTRPCASACKPCSSTSASGELGLAVRPLPGVAAFALQVVDVESARRLGVGRDGDDPGGRAALEPVQHQAGEQAGGEVVDGEGALQPVGGEVLGGPEPAHVVDQHIQPRVGAADRGGESAYPGLAGHVGGERVHRRVAGLADDPGGGGLGPRLVPAGDADAGP